MQRDFWDKAAASKNLRNEWICDKNVSDEDCLRQIVPFLNSGKTLDLGCGPGRLSMGYGVDVSPKMLALAKNGRYKLTDGKTIPFKDGFFDNVFSVLMFQHINIRNKLEYINEVYRVLKPGGIFRLQYVNRADRGPMSHPIKDDTLIDMIELTGFLVWDYGSAIFEEWTWLTAIK